MPKCSQKTLGEVSYLADLGAKPVTQPAHGQCLVGSRHLPHVSWPSRREQEKVRGHGDIPLLHRTAVV